MYRILPHRSFLSRFTTLPVAGMMLVCSVSLAAAATQGGVPEGRPDPEMLKALEKKKLEAERLRRRVEELEALLRMKNEISEAKSRAIEQLEKARQKKKRSQ